MNYVGIGGEPGEGRYFVLRVAEKEALVAEATFESNGCIVITAVGQWLCQFILGRKVSLLTQLDSNDLRVLYGTVPEGKEYALFLPAEALKNLKPL
ncbi:MAG: iron-sulfur cluster assembly scaffold protein [Armatimonadetes bacterium]|nr:iron-sulfur cluster assembly scaffold protein [Armatimonadota bacterium]